MTYEEVLNELKSMADPKFAGQLAMAGINNNKALGITMPQIRELAKKAGKNHEIAGQLWKSGIHEGKLLSIFVEEPQKVTEQQLDDWVKDIDSWDICDQCMAALTIKTPYAYDKAFEWVKSEEEFIRRSGIVTLVAITVHDKKQSDEVIAGFLDTAEQYCLDERNFVKKAVNWLIRQIGKRSLELNPKAIKTAENILEKYPDSKTARWIAKDAIRELKSEAVIERLKKKKKRQEAKN